MINPTNTTPGVGDAGCASGDHDSGTVDIQILLNEKFTVSKAFFDRIRTHVEESLPGMIHGQLYTAKQLCGTDFWSQMTRPQRISVGKCIAHMVSRGDLSLEFAEPTSANAKRYQLK